MIEAIDRVLSALRRRPQGRKWVGRGVRLSVLAGAIAVLAFWLPGAITAYTARLVPEAAKTQIGAQLLAETERVAGAPCRSPAGARALQTLSDRLFPSTERSLIVLPTTLKTTAHLPGGTILLSHTLVEDFETPDVVAGYALAEHLRASEGTTLGTLLEASPFRASLALLSTGHLRDEDVARMAEWLVIKPNSSVPEQALINAMRDRGIATAPYGYAVDISGETTATLIAGEATGAPILDDNEWIALQTICSE